ncbi:MAG: type II secretion system protein [Desulfuromonadales bacterium]
MRVYTDHRGFTLIELAVVLVIVGMLVGLGSSMVGPLTTYVRVRETREIQEAALQSVISWASSRNTIPGNTEFATAAKSREDAWGQDMIYIFDGNLNTPPITRDTICGRRSTSLNLALDAATTKTNVAFAVLSRADNDAFQSKRGDGSTPVSGPVSDTITAYSASGKNPDIIRWVTLDELRSKIGCQGAPLKILNNELPFANAGGYNATIAADGGVPFTAPDIYGWCVQTTVDNTAPAAGLVFKKPDNSVILPSQLCKSNCSPDNPVAVASWFKAGRLGLSGTPTPSNSYFFAVYVSDSNGNIASKPFVLTVNP